MKQSNTTNLSITPANLEKIAKIIRERCIYTTRKFLQGISESEIVVKEINTNKKGVLVSCICLVRDLYECFVLLIENHESVSFNS